MEDGDTVEIAVFGREALFGLVTAVVSRQAFGRYIVQLAGTASRIPAERMQEVIAARPNIRQLLIRFAEALLAQTFQTVACNAIHGVEARCCRWILSMHDRMNQDTLPLTHELLAEMLGVQRSTVSLVTHALQTEGLIRQQRGAITVTDRAGLEAVACECYGKIRHTFERLLPGTYARQRPRSLRSR
jgi:CRP-like cAMP-binding protein